MISDIPIAKSNDVMSGIQPMNVGGIDLNLLKVLAALLEERSVTAAGRRIGLSQPATSNALRRLRELIGDPLLVRGSNGGLELTPHAETLLEPVQRAVAAVADAFRPPVAFDPRARPAHRAPCRHRHRGPGRAPGPALRARARGARASTSWSARPITTR